MSEFESQLRTFVADRRPGVEVTKIDCLTCGFFGYILHEPDEKRIGDMMDCPSCWTVLGERNLPLTPDETEVIAEACMYAYRVGRADGERAGKNRLPPDGLWPMMLGTFPELRALLPASVLEKGSGS